MINYRGHQDLIPSDRIVECKEEMCELYCVWISAASSQKSLEMKCADCPLNNLLNDDYWEERKNKDGE